MVEKTVKGGRGRAWCSLVGVWEGGNAPSAARWGCKPRPRTGHRGGVSGLPQLHSTSSLPLEK